MVNFVLKILRNLTEISPKVAEKNVCLSKSGHIYMKDIQCAGTNEESNFPIFFSIMVDFVLKIHKNFSVP